jgi:hypothetical protein
MTRTEKIVELFWHRFIHLDSCYPLQYKNNGGGYVLVKEKLIPEIILEHLRGIKTIGMYGSADSTTKWLCIDIDTLDEIAVREVQNHASRFSIPYLTEFSGKKGYHLWVFFDKPYPNKVVRALANQFAFNHEVFPKQDHIGQGKLGNLVKAPLGKHQVTGNWCLFLDKDLRPEKDQYGVLAGIQTINPIQVLKERFPEIYTKVCCNKPHGAVFPQESSKLKIPVMKDCIHNAIMKGTDQGSRNEVGHIIASELRRLGVQQEQAEVIMASIWNTHNKPPLEQSEIRVIINSAYGNGEYSYGCKGGSPLRSYLACVGFDDCLYMKVLTDTSNKQ